MNRQEQEILRTLLLEGPMSQRALADRAGHSLGVVNRSLRALLAEGMLSAEGTLSGEGTSSAGASPAGPRSVQPLPEAASLREALGAGKLVPTEKARLAWEACAPKNAVILAAGFGMRMVPINLAAPKALLEVRGEPLIERQIRHLHEAGVRDITVVVGFMKERFEYLIDAFGVRLAVNPAYAEKNNLSSLARVADRLSNTFVLPSDLWCAENPFLPREMYSWYMVSDQTDPEAPVRVNRRQELVPVGERETGNRMIGIAFLLEKDAAPLRRRLREMDASGAHDGDFWEAALLEPPQHPASPRPSAQALPSAPARSSSVGVSRPIAARVVPDSQVVEINTYEQLRQLDGESSHLRSEALDVIAGTFGVKTEEIKDISVLKKGMTNRSFLFSLGSEKYIMRIPGEGTSLLINRAQEAAVFRAISGLGLCDDPVYLNPANGYKITKYLANARVCDPSVESDLERCMAKLRAFHEMNLRVPHTFDLFAQIDFYESLWQGQPSLYKDYAQTKARVLSLRPFIDSQPKAWCLTHIDAVPDNFLFYAPESSGSLPSPAAGTPGNSPQAPGGGSPAPAPEALQLTDWEYAGMQDPHLDLAMFVVYSFFDKSQADHLMSLYFGADCGPAVRAKIYSYIAAAGLLWSNWCEYKRTLGVEFGEYSLRQYRYAKEFYRFALEEIRRAEETESRAEPGPAEETGSGAEPPRSAAIAPSAEPPRHTVRRAIILAAGLGKRMRPLTLSVPKPLVRVRGVRMIDSVIAALRQNGIEEIVVVVGHLKEQFLPLRDEVPGLVLIENPWYASANNISSLFVARDYLQDCIILDGDQLIRNPAVLSPSFDRSGYNAVWCEGETREWLLSVKDGLVQSCSRTGGRHGWQLFSVSRWTAEDGRRLRAHLETEFLRKRNRDIYWDDLPLFCYPDSYALGIRPMGREDVLEIDSLRELAAFDPTYAPLLENSGPLPPG